MTHGSGILQPSETAKLSSFTCKSRLRWVFSSICLLLLLLLNNVRKSRMLLVSSNDMCLRVRLQIAQNDMRMVGAFIYNVNNFAERKIKNILSHKKGRIYLRLNFSPKSSKLEIQLLCICNPKCYSTERFCSCTKDLG